MDNGVNDDITINIGNNGWTDQKLLDLKKIENQNSKGISVAIKLHYLKKVKKCQSL
jgi:hypothetical protein